MALHIYIIFAVCACVLACVRARVRVCWQTHVRVRSYLYNRSWVPAVRCTRAQLESSKVDRESITVGINLHYHLPCVCV